jgi:hypothetical protein
MKTNQITIVIIMTLINNSTLYTPGEFLELFRTAFQQLSDIEHLSCDVLLPSVVFIIVRAQLPHLGAYLHFLTDFAHSEPADEYTLVTYEVKMICIPCCFISITGGI